MLGDIADTCLGKMLDQRKNKGDYQPYLANVNVRWGSFDLDNLPQMRFLKSEEERYGLQYGDILICEGGEPGRCAIWKDQIPGMKFQKALHRVRVHEVDVDFRWLFYRFLYARYRGEFDQYFSGTTTIKHMPGEKLVKIRIDLPEKYYQSKIADILSSYDDLIENNQKQIKLLEEAAQRLYKEWFVDLRFPGYEETPIVDGVPAGWEKLPIGELIEKIPRTTQIMTSEYEKEGLIPIIDQSREFIAGYTNNQSSLVNVGKPVIVFGDHTRILKYIQFPFAKGADGTQLIVSNKERMPQSLFYCSLIGVDLSNYHYARHFKYLKAEEIFVPTQEIADTFDSFASPLFSKVQRLRDIVINAANARDRLLPKLMSGEIEV